MKEIGTGGLYDKGLYETCWDVTVTVMESTICVDILKSQLNYISVEVVWEVFISFVNTM